MGFRSAFRAAFVDDPFRAGAGFGVAAASSNAVTLEMPNEVRPMPQPHETWTPTYGSSFSYKMAPKEMVPLWFRVKTTGIGPYTLSLGGTDASKYTAEFFKPFGQVVDNSDAYKRASLSASPTGTYYDPLNPIPSGSNNFSPIATDTWEYVYLVLTCKSTTTQGNHSLSITLGSASISLSVHCWGNISIPDAPSRQMLVLANSSAAQKGILGGYVSGGEANADVSQTTCGNAVTDFLKRYRMTPYQTSLAFLSESGGTLNVDSLGSSSFRSMQIDRLSSGDWKMWRADPQGQTSHRTLSYAQAAEATIAANPSTFTNMILYVWDEPDSSSSVIAGNIKTILDNWKAGSPSTKLLLTVDKDWFSGSGPTAVGLTEATYGSQLILVPVVNNIGGSKPAISSYQDSATGMYTSCQGNCQTQLNSNSTSGTDQGYVDYAYIDYPRVRTMAEFLLSTRTGWRTKLRFMLHYDTMQAWLSWDGTSSNDASKNPWLSARRFGVAGDGTMVYPGIPNYQPHASIPAFASNSRVVCPSIRLLYATHASFMADLCSLYSTANGGVNPADSIVTSHTSFSTNYGDYQSLRVSIGDALEAGTTLTQPAATQVKFVQQPTGTAPATNISPSITVAVRDQYGATRTADNTTQITLAKVSGPGSLSGTLTRTCSSGVATFNDIQLSADGSYTLSASASGLTSDTSSSFAIAFSPTSITNIKAWFKADGTITKDGSNVVSQWSDDAGTGNHMAQATAGRRPTWVDSVLNGKPIVRFDSTSTATGKFLSKDGWNGGGVLDDMTVFIVHKPGNTTSTMVPVGSSDQFGDWSIFTNRNDKFVSIQGKNSETGTILDGSTAESSSFKVVSATLSYKVGPYNDRATVRLNGSVEVNDQITGAARPEAMRIGSGYGTDYSALPNTYWYNGDIAEVIVYAKILNSTELGQVESYLTGKYGL